jgi:hypothetical protein
MNSLLLINILIAVLLVAPRIAISQIADSVLTGTRETRDFQAVRELRLAQFFVIGEKSIEPDAKQMPQSVLLRSNEVVSGVRYLEDNSDINAFSILDIKLRVDNWVLPTLEKKKYNILLVADLCKKGEETWQRISVINRYTMEIVKSSLSDSSDFSETPLSAPGNFYVSDAVLSNNPFLREGDNVVVLFLFTLKKDTIYSRDLEDAQRNRRSLLTLDSQELYLISTGNKPQRYAVKEGDRIRIRLLRAEYPILGQAATELFLKNEKLSRRVKYGDIVNVEDELDYTYREFGYHINVVPMIAWGSLGHDPEADEFNPIAKNPSVGSNVFLDYEGRSCCKNVLLNYVLPGIHLSLLGMKDPNGTKFTLGLVHSLIPSLRQNFGVFFGWHDLKAPCFGVTFSPSINFKVLVGAEGQKKE